MTKQEFKNAALNLNVNFDNARISRAIDDKFDHNLDGNAWGIIYTAKSKKLVKLMRQLVAA